MKKRLYRQSPEPEEQIAGWQTIYCSLTLIIVVFFVMLVSYSIADRGKMNHLKSTVSTKAGHREKAKIENGDAGLKQDEPSKDGISVGNAILSLHRAGEQAGLKNDVSVERFLGGVKIKLNSDVAFSEGSALINRRIYPYLDEMARVAREQNLSLRVAGHTDDVPIHNVEFPTNWELSAARAANVIRYLIREQGLPANRLTAEGFAQYRPLASNGTPEGRKKNRRIEIYLGRERDPKPLKDDAK